ncbi:biopolymer transporter ExbD [Devosia geojensis]|uniref:Biopolymer transporter ExbD n=1 Tax=Devosia geojensis TaxID=443610 RepID=A0A0F5FWR7_9HYPH|nr:protein TolR [Devosia geojensis]KKB13299.1 biopolymer transporter ExbD [Devosia geojensis]
MGMSLGGGGRRRGKAAPISEINVTPMVDVMLVLLIIFMVAAPLMTVGVPIDLPQSRARAMEPQARPVTITVSADGAISIEGEPVAYEAVVATVEAQVAAGADDRLYIRADTAAAYGQVMRVMGALSGAGFEKIGLITAPEANP